MAPETVTKWINIYNKGCNNEYFNGGTLYSSESEAKENVIGTHLITVPVTFEI